MSITDEARARIRDFRIAERERLEAVIKEEPPYMSEYKNAWQRRELLIQENYSQR